MNILMMYLLYTSMGACIIMIIMCTWALIIHDELKKTLSVIWLFLIMMAIYNVLLLTQ